MCGSTNIIKQDGLYVCQDCGTKYSVEEAKKMMIEGKVDVTGSTIKVDNSASIENYYKIAESAYDSSNLKETESYCNKIIEIDPENYKAWLLKGKAAGWQSSLANIRLEEAVNCFRKAINNAPPEEKEKIKKETSDEVIQLSKALLKQSNVNFLEYSSEVSTKSLFNCLKLIALYAFTFLTDCGVSIDDLKNHIAATLDSTAYIGWVARICVEYNGSDGHPTEFQFRTFISKSDYAIEIIKTAIDIYSVNKDVTILRYKHLIEIDSKVINAFSYTYSSGWTTDKTLTPEAKQARIDDIMVWHKKIKELDPKYQIPERPVPESGGACYIATAVYGSYDCPEVWTLRRYRDYFLARSIGGRIFIKCYYFISPMLVNCFGNQKWFHKFWRNKLDNMVEKLNRMGVKNTPYQDKRW